MQLTGFSILSDDDLLTFVHFKKDATQLERELAQRLQLALALEREHDGYNPRRPSKSGSKEAAN
jgi:hypothetical protein